LVRKSRLRAALTEADIYDSPDGSSDSALPTAISRLKRLLPGDLAQSIKSGTEKRSFRLMLPPDDIFVVPKKARLDRHAPSSRHRSAK
jgi:hypothetical protein